MNKGKIIIFLIIAVILSNCSLNKKNEKNKIISLVYNELIGKNHYYFGTGEKIPKLPPPPPPQQSYDSIYKAIKKGILVGAEKQRRLDFISRENEFRKRIKQYRLKLQNLKRKIILNNIEDIDSEIKMIAIQKISSIGFETKFINNPIIWDVNKINNKSPYELISSSDVSNEKIDSIIVGSLRFSEIGYNKNKDKSILIFDWYCGVMCGNSSLVILNKIEDNWIITDTINLR